MSTFAPVIEEQGALPPGATVLREHPGLTVAVDPDMELRTAAALLTREESSQVVLASGPAAQLALPPAPTLAQVLDGLAGLGLRFHGADCLYFVPERERAALLAEPTPSHVRELSPEDAPAFAAFVQSSTPEDLDEAYVELDHWLVVGAFDGGRLVAAASAYPWRDGTLADIGVITLPTARHQGHGVALVREICRRIIALGYEPQYRCQLSNDASRSLAPRAGLALFGTRDVVVAEPVA